MQKLYAHIVKHYRAYSLTANILNAVAMAGFALMGLLNQVMALTWLVGWGLVFATLLGVGKLLDQEINDLDKVREHENESDRTTKE